MVGIPKKKAFQTSYRRAPKHERTWRKMNSSSVRRKSRCFCNNKDRSPCPKRLRPNELHTKASHYSIQSPDLRLMIKDDIMMLSQRRHAQVMVNLW